MRVDKLITQSYVLLMLGMFLASCGFLLIFPVMPVFAMQRIGLAEGNIGLIVGVFSLSALLCRPFAGYLTDRYSPKRLLTAALILFSLVICSYQFIFTIPSLFFLRVMHGICWSVIFTSSYTLVANLLPDKRRGEGIGYFAMLLPLAMVIAPALGLELSPAQGNFTVVFSTGAVFGLIAFLLICMIKPAPVSGYRTLKFRFSALYEKRVFGIFLMQLSYSFAYSGILIFIPIFVIKTGPGSSSIFFIFFALSVLASRLVIVRKTFDNRGPDRLIAVGYTCVAAGAFTLAMSYSMAGFCLGGIIAGLGGGMVTPTLNAMAVSVVEPGLRGRANATLLTANDLGMGLGAIIAGYLIQHTSYRTGFMFAAIISAAATALYFLFERKRYLRNIYR